MILRSKERFRDIFEFTFPSLKHLGRTFVRMQEFYDSPFPELRGQYFTLDQFTKITHQTIPQYCASNGGYALNGQVLQHFFKLYHEHLTSHERIFFDVLFQKVTHETLSNIFVIGMLPSIDWNTQVHELSHAIYYLDADYRLFTNEIYSVASPTQQKKIERKMRKFQYYERFWNGIYQDERIAFAQSVSKRLLALLVYHLQLRAKCNVYLKLNPAVD